MGADISLLKMSMNICCVGGKQFCDRIELLICMITIAVWVEKNKLVNRIERFWEKERLEFL